MDNYWESETLDIINRAKKHADKYYSWEYRAPKWIEMLDLMEIEDELTERKNGSDDAVDGDNDGGVRGTDSSVQ